MILENAISEITEMLAATSEWLLVYASGKSFAFQNSEIEITLEKEKIFCEFLDEKGFQLWRVIDYKIENKNLIVEATRNFGRERERIKFVPRISPGELSAEIELAKIEKANQIAALILSGNPGSKLARISLNKENGRFAEIVFENRTGKRIAALADVSGNLTAETLLTTGILWLVKLQSRRKNPVNELWILAERKVYNNLRRLHALLSKNWQAKIFIKEIIRRKTSVPNEKINSKENLQISELWREIPPKLMAMENFTLSETAIEITKLAADKIDIIFTKHGETIRFFGLPFARVRKIGDAEKIWFGTTRERRILNEKTREEFFDLIENLKTYRSFDSPNTRHEFYRLAPEAWLEAILRRNINLLDGNLILSPVHHQFRTSGDFIDLLALRKDGRLIIIELKVEPDREMIFQAADYWRKLELQRRRGILRKAKIFGDLVISDEPAMVYLAAPTLSFHREFAFLSKTVSPEIGIYKFQLNENWREDLHVMNVSKI